MSRLARRPITPAELTESVMRRIWRRTRITETGCIEWVGAIAPNGYGRVGFGGKSRTAMVHRLTLVWALGTELPHEDVDHLCRNRACVNPSHLESVTRRENIRRGIGRGSETIRLEALVGTCAQGHDLRAETAWVKQGRGRVCRLCNKETRKRYAARKRGAA